MKFTAADPAHALLMRFERNICRCTGYAAIIRAVAEAVPRAIGAEIDEAEGESS